MNSVAYFLFIYQGGIAAGVLLWSVVLFLMGRNTVEDVFPLRIGMVICVLMFLSACVVECLA